MRNSAISGVKKTADRTTNYVVYSTDICAETENAFHPKLLLAHLRTI